MGNELEKQNSSMLVSGGKFIEQINAYAQQIELPFTDDEKKRVMNAIRVIDPILKDNGLSWEQMDRNNVVNVLQQVAFLKVNPSATPRECYFILRNKKSGKQDTYGKDIYVKEIEFGIEGAGNDTILRNFGVGVKDIKSYMVREGDDFTGVTFDGWEEVLPQYKPNYKSKKSLHAVYLIRKENGEIEVSISAREDVKQSLLAHIRQNGADETLLRELAKESLDTLLTDPKYVSGVIKKEKNTKGKDGKWTKETYSVPLIGLAWTSAVSSEAVVERKLRNHATRRYPKNFSHVAVNALYEETFEEERYERKTLVDADETLQIADENFEQNANKETIKTPPKKTTTKPKVETPKETLVVVAEETFVEIVEEEETIVESSSVEETEEEDWTK